MNGALRQNWRVLGVLWASLQLCSSNSCQHHASKFETAIFWTYIPLSIFPRVARTLYYPQEQDSNLALSLSQSHHPLPSQLTIRSQTQRSSRPSYIHTTTTSRLKKWKELLLLCNAAPLQSDWPVHLAPPPSAPLPSPPLKPPNPNPALSSWPTKSPTLPAGSRLPS
jgi:hypothetical protein